jgi:hypothetical protein
MPWVFANAPLFGSEAPYIAVDHISHFWGNRAYWHVPTELRRSTPRLTSYGNLPYNRFREVV